MSEMDEMRSQNKKPIAEAKSTKTLSGGAAPKGPTAHQLKTMADAKTRAENAFRPLRAKAEAAAKARAGTK
jgi:hypothetical protein